MDLINEFRVPVSVERAWGVLTDVERIAPCLPGAQLQEVDGDQYRGIVKVKLGPITAQYKGAASFVEQNEDARRVVLRAEGRDTRGQGNASATITATMEPDGDGTAVKVVTDLTVTGKVAQFGRGLLADVSGKLIDQFVENLHRDVLTTPEAAPASAPSAAASAAPSAPPTTDGSGSAPDLSRRRLDQPEPRPVDLMATAGSPVIKRVAPLLGVVLVVVLLWRRHRRGR